MGDDGAGQLSDYDESSQDIFWRCGPGRYAVELGPEERALLKELPLQLKQAFSEESERANLRRLFPPAYATDPQAEAGYRALVGQELEGNKAAELETLSQTAEATELSAEELDAWMRAINDIRLWLGTLLDVTEEEMPDDPQDPPHILYHVLTALQSLVIDALAEDLDG
ncbi:MAG TPA: DUF2017 family protein [Acidimicrobiales bacterium]|nr:DUF2017 family protein [Acidimicrobiales bacterium]